MAQRADEAILDHSNDIVTAEWTASPLFGFPVSEQHRGQPRGRLSMTLILKDFSREGTIESYRRYYIETEDSGKGS